MSVSNGQAVDETVTNAAFMSRTVDTSTTGTVTLDNTSDGDSGATVANTQQAVNETFDAVGMTGQDDANRKVYSSNNVIADGDDRKVAIGKIDSKFPASTTSTSVPKFSDTDATLIETGVLIDGSNNITTPGNVVAVNATFSGDLTVNGTTTTLNTTTTDVEDKNITVNKGGSDASSEGAGLTVERTGTDGSFVYEDALASKYKLGALGSELQAATVSHSQVFTNKDYDGGTASNTNRTTLSKDTLANLTSLARKQGNLFYDTTNDDVVYDTGAALLALLTSASSSAVPAGVIQDFGGTSAPTGYLLCNGAAVSRATFATLYAVVGDAFGEGDGSTTFNVPDTRGRFPRGVDGGAGNDPDAGSRLAMNTGGNTGDNVGSVQGGDTNAHTHDIDHDHPNSTSSNDGAHDHFIFRDADEASNILSGTEHPTDKGNTGDARYVMMGSVSDPDVGKTDTVAAHNHDVNLANFTGSSGSDGGSETRPINYYVNRIIKT